MNKEELNLSEMLFNRDERLLDIIKELREENKRLNNIIKELEEILEYGKNDYGEDIDIETHNIDSEFLRGNSWEADYILTKLQELKEGK